MLGGPIMQRRLAHRLEMMAGEWARKRAERDRRIVGPKRRRADLLDRFAGGLGEDRDGVDIAELALIGRHAGRGVAFGELDVGVALARGKQQIVGRSVVLEIDEGLAVSTP